VTLFTLGVFLLGIWSLAFFASHTLRVDMQRLLGEQQFSTASFVAAGVNDDLGERLGALEIVAREFTPAGLQSASAMQTILDRKPLLKNLFNGGVVVLDAGGTAIADAPILAGRVGVSFIDREHVAAALKDGRSMIGRPVMGKKLPAPVFGMAVPIRDGQGKVIGALLGVTDLLQVNFIDKIAQNVYGKTGGYLLVSPKDRLIFAASDKHRIMETLPAPDVTPVMDRFIDGYEGSDILVTPNGVEVLASAKGIPLTDWYAATVLPTEEAFAPIRAMQQRVLVATMLITLITGGLVWAMLRRELSPLLAAAERLATRSEMHRFPRPLPVERDDEIGTLISGFNHLLSVLEQREEALRASEFRWKFAIEGAGDGLWDWNLVDNTVFFTTRWKAILGFAEDEIGNGPDEWEGRIHPDDSARVKASLQAYLDGRTPTYVNEHRIRGKDGSYKWVLDRGMVVSRGDDGTPLRMIGTHADITERKHMEYLVQQLAYCDALTRLPNRRLLDDRLSQAMAASKRNGRHCALMLLDLDNFKPLNDVHGHAVGDLLLCEVAVRLKSCVREVDTVARFGGDEFVVLLSALSTDRAESDTDSRIVAEKIRLALSKPYRISVEHDGVAATVIEHHCTVSIGVVVFAGLECSRNDLLRLADTAMYQSKAAGRNTVHHSISGRGSKGLREERAATANKS